MNAYFEFLREVRARPAVFVGTAPTLLETLHRIEAVLLGFELREGYEKGREPTEWNQRFRDFVSTKNGLTASKEAGVLATLEQAHPVPMTVWNDYFALVDEFESVCLTS